MKVYFESNGWRVTDSVVRTPKKSFSLDSLEAVSVKRTFFLLTAFPAMGAIGLTFLWWRYLYPSEIITMLVCSISTLVATYHLGSLKVEALSLKDEEGGIVYCRFALLSKVRDSIDDALHDRRTLIGGRKDG